MRYLLMLHGDQTTWGAQSDQAHAAEMAGFSAFERAARDAGAFVAAHALVPADHAVTVRAGVETTSPPDPHTEQIGAVYVLDCADYDEAVHWAQQIPLIGSGGFSAVEVRAETEDRS